MMGKVQRDALLIVLFALVASVIIANIYLIKLISSGNILKSNDFDPRTRAAEIQIPSTGAYWGIYIKPCLNHTTCDWSFSGKKNAIQTIETKVGRKFTIDHSFYRWDDVIPGAYETWTAQEGRIPLINWASRKNDGTPVKWADIANGVHDSWIEAQADRLKALGKPVFVAFQHEPEDEESSGNFGTTTDYRAAWKHVVEKFRERGASNVIWWWIMTGHIFKADPSKATDFYPGDDIIDWIAADTYNFVTRDGKWATLEERATPFHEWAKSRNKPLALSEWGTEEDPSISGRKADWFIETQTLLKSWPEIKAVVYFHSDNSYPWWIDTSDSSLQAFSLVGQDPYFNPAVGSVNPTVVPPTDTPTPTPSPTNTPTPVPPTPTNTPTPVPPTPTNTPTPTKTPTPTPTSTPTPSPTNTPTPVPQILGSTVRIWAYGTTADGIYPTMQLQINGIIVRTWTDVKPNLFGFAKEYAYYSPQHLGPGTVLRVFFANDVGGQNSKDKRDRNLNVDRINVDGADFESEQMFSTGSWSKVGGCNDGYKNTPWLHCKGYFEYPIK